MRAGRFTLDALAQPIVQAPMGGGPSTPALAAAVTEGGGLGFLAAGYKSVEAVRCEIAAVRAATARAFGVNVFVPGSPARDRAALERYARALGGEAVRYGVELGEPRHDDDGWAAKLALLEREGPAVASFTFGCPSEAVVRCLQAAGSAVWVTVTSAEEGRAAQAAGADALVVQGFEAGGHRSTFEERGEEGVGLLALLQLVTAAVDLPLVAAGGIMTGRGIAAVLAAGARAAALGSAFMLASEAATAPAHRAALGDPSRPTAVTRAFTGRAARGIVNRFMREHAGQAPPAYPEVHHLTAPVRAAARSSGDAEGLHLWAGQGHSLAQAAPAGELVRKLGEEARIALREAARHGAR